MIEDEKNTFTHANVSQTWHLTQPRQVKNQMALCDAPIF